MAKVRALRESLRLGMADGSVPSPVLADAQSPGACRIAVKVVPGSRKTRVVGVLPAVPQPRLKVNVAAPPEDGRANRAVCELLAEFFGVAARSVSVVSGQTSPEKMVRIEGLSVEACRTRVSGL